ncbi:MAG: hypothetical protein K8U57_36410 [Planctomycetes bacterium]|nr:hypothetical protein [Planctomycetota bacterium]
MSRFLTGMVLVTVLVGCSKPSASTPAETPKPVGDPSKSDPKATPKPPEATEEDAVKFVEKLGGTVKRDDTKPGKPVVKVELWESELTDAGLKELAPLTQLTSLSIGGTKITDAGLKELAHFSDLTTLSLRETAVTDVGLKELANLKKLSELGLNETKITDVGLKELANIKTLRDLTLPSTFRNPSPGKTALEAALPNCHILVSLGKGLK